MSEEQKAKIGFANKGEKHGLWKGEKITYKGLHAWVRRNYGESPVCEDCGKRKCWIDWANVSGKYTRERSDWKRLCRKCHYIYDRGIKGNPNTKITDEMIAIIRNTPKKKGSIIKLAKQFGVHRVTIRRYCRDIPRIYA